MSVINFYNLMVFDSWDYYIFSRFFKIVNRDEFRI